MCVPMLREALANSSITLKKAVAADEAWQAFSGEGWRDYFSSMWNWLDASFISARASRHRA